MAGYDPSTALIVVDVQNDFADPAGSLYVRGGEEVVDTVNLHVKAAAEAGALVVYTQDWHPPSTPHFARDGGVWPVHCVGETWGAALRPDLLVRGATLLKGTGGEDGYSGFSVRDPLNGEQGSTALESLLKARGIGRVIIAGIATDYCVKETALDATRLGFETLVLEAACRAVDLQPGDGDRAFDAMLRAGVRLE